MSSALGAPYDPHTTLNYLKVAPFNTSFSRMSNKATVDGLRLSEPMSKAELDKLVGDVLESTDEPKRKELYRQILTAIHEQALFYPVSYQVSHGLRASDVVPALSRSPTLGSKTSVTTLTSTTTFFHH
jgi:nickel transport system substrate-binding protein